MRIVEPSVEIIDIKDYQEILQKLEKIGRVCYKSENKITENSAEKFISGIVKSGHEAVIEHESISVRVICDRGVSHEIVRHRLASYCQESTRYCNYSKNKFDNEISVIDICSGFKYDLFNPNDLKKYEIWQEAMKNSEKAYFDLLEAGATPQEARSVLPNSLKTEIIMTMNLREWRYFLKLRTSEAAHPQIREIADMILDLFKEKLPIFFEDINSDSKKEEN